MPDGDPARLRRFTEVVASILNSMLGQGFIRPSGPGVWKLGYPDGIPAGVPGQQGYVLSWTGPGPYDAAWVPGGTTPAPATLRADNAIITVDTILRTAGEG